MATGYHKPAKPTIDISHVKPYGIYSMTDASEVLKVTRRTIDRWRAKGYIKAAPRKMSKTLYIKGSEIIKANQQINIG